MGIRSVCPDGSGIGGYRRTPPDTRGGRKIAAATGCGRRNCVLTFPVRNSIFKKKRTRPRAAGGTEKIGTGRKEGVSL